LKVKVSQQFFQVLQGCGPSLSQVQVEVVESKSIPTVCFFWAAGCAVPSLSQVQVEVLKVKVSQQLLFLVLQVVVPSLSQQVELLKVKYPNSSLFLVL
jgi:hypothetical protein